MSGRIIRTELVLDDLDELSEYIRQRDPPAALRFLSAAEDNFRRLALMPSIGERFETENSLYQDIRCLPISGFPSHIVYYKPLGDGALILRIIHGARDIDRAFGHESSAEHE
jgi:toxin ParE1/3/4